MSNVENRKRYKVISKTFSVTVTGSSWVMEVIIDPFFTNVSSALRNCRGVHSVDLGNTESSAGKAKEAAKRGDWA